MAASSSGNRRTMSIVEDHGVYSSSCGYCRSGRRSSVSSGAWAYRLTVDDYQELLDRGWRRSGMHIYKPDLSKTCCPPYTIRLEADKFVPSKEQKRVRRRMNRYLEGYDGSQVAQDEGKSRKVAKEKLQDELSEQILRSLIETLRRWAEETGLASAFQVPPVEVRKTSDKLKKQLRDEDGVAEYTSNAAFVVASSAKKQCRNDATPTDLAHGLASKLVDQLKSSGITVKASKGHLNFYTSSTGHENMVVEDRNGNHGDNMDSNGNLEPRRRTLEIRMQRSAFDEEEYQLYKKYQIAVHNDTLEHVKQSSYCRFLVDTPLVPCRVGSQEYGSFHQQYRIDGRLVAVGVVDILPKCLSSKYLFWDPDFAFLSLGKFSALQEIEWVQNAHRSSPFLEYYYLGYYIHSCPKMRYKAAYYPSELLCPTKFKWVPFEAALPLVESGATCIADVQTPVNGVGNRAGVPSEENDEDMNDIFEMQQAELSDGIDLIHSLVTAIDAVPMEKLQQVPLLCHKKLVRLQDLEAMYGREFLNRIKWQLSEYWPLVGEQLASRMAYCISAR